MEFRTWLEQQPAQNNVGNVGFNASNKNINKPWKANKEEILNHWKGLPVNMPLPQLRVIPYDYKGKTFKFDAIRITGSDVFITAILSKIKDLLAYENDKDRLNLVYKQQVDNKTQLPIPSSYVVYINARERGKQ